MSIATLTTILIVAAMISFFTALAEDKDAPKAPPVTEKTERHYKNVKPEEFDKLRQDKNAVILDVRTKKEYQEAHLPGAKLIDINGDDFEQEVAKLDKSKTYLVHCAAGGRSSRACKKMEQIGFKNLYNLEGGLTGWEKAGKPVEK